MVPAIPLAQTAKEIERAKEIQRILSILHQWGIHTLGQLAGLDRNDLAARLGNVAVKLWERAKGRSQRLLKLVSPPESLIESFEFENEIETVEPLLFMLRRFLEQLAQRLNAIYLVARELRFRITFADKSHYERIFKIPQPTNNTEVLFRMLHTHLENFTSPQPIVTVELEAQPSRPTRQQFGLFETALRDPAQLHETLARLIGLLGADRVGHPVLEETHRPDAFHMEPFAWELPDNAEQEQPLAIPLRRFRKPPPATVLLEENKPVHIRAGKIEGGAIAQAGPYPLSGNWWDESAWSRVEWDVQIANGSLLRCHSSEEKSWVIDGVYD
jgi:Nucleotidyltransferase/DNA polymerase involved in DNA repair